MKWKTRFDGGKSSKVMTMVKYRSRPWCMSVPEVLAHARRTLVSIALEPFAS